MHGTYCIRYLQYVAQYVRMYVRYSLFRSSTRRATTAKHKTQSKAKRPSACLSLLPAHRCPRPAAAALGSPIPAIMLNSKGHSLSWPNAVAVQWAAPPAVPAPLARWRFLPPFVLLLLPPPPPLAMMLFWNVVIAESGRTSSLS